MLRDISSSAVDGGKTVPNRHCPPGFSIRLSFPGGRTTQLVRVRAREQEAAELIVTQRGIQLISSGLIRIDRSQSPAPVFSLSTKEKMNALTTENLIRSSAS